MVPTLSPMNSDPSGKSYKDPNKASTTPPGRVLKRQARAEELQVSAGNLVSHVGREKRRSGVTSTPSPAMEENLGEVGPPPRGGRNLANPSLVGE